jgi:hypothetical protein
MVHSSNVGPTASRQVQAVFSAASKKYDKSVWDRLSNTQVRSQYGPSRGYVPTAATGASKPVFVSNRGNYAGDEEDYDAAGPKSMFHVPRNSQSTPNRGTATRQPANAPRTSSMFNPGPAPTSPSTKQYSKPTTVSSGWNSPHQAPRPSVQTKLTLNSAPSPRSTYMSYSGCVCPPCIVSTRLPLTSFSVSQFSKRGK